MKSEINRLLVERNIDLLWVTGAAFQSPEVYYLTDGAELTRAWILLRPDREPLLCHLSMEREAAGATGLRTIDFNELDVEKLSRRINDPLLVEFEMFTRLVQREKLAGRLAVHGLADPSQSHALLEKIREHLPQIELVRDVPPVLDTARSTKDPQEITRLKDVARRALEALSCGLELIRKAHAKGDILLDENNNLLRVGDVKACIRKALAERALQETHQSILSIGAQAGIPHASSPDDTPLRTGSTVVLDLFPCETGGGYYFDITRSFLIASGPDEALQLYEDVLEAQEKAIAAIRPGLDGSFLQELVCDHFEALGHPTLRSSPGTTEGYVHSLGHGIGLQVHEYPYLRLQDEPDEHNRLFSGSVFTVEPGLYYPEQEMGIRIEDVVYIDNQGQPRILAPYEKFSVLELEG